MMDKTEFEVFVTVTGFKHYFISSPLYVGKCLRLVFEPENSIDKFAVAVYDGENKVGYVANSKDTVRKGTVSAAQLAEFTDKGAEAEITDMSSYDAVCLVKNVKNLDSMCLRAFEYYNVGDYEAAGTLFLELGKRFDSVFLLQYTADCFIKLGKFNEALPFVENALKKEADNEISLTMHGTILKNTGDVAGAVKDFSRVLSKKENSILRNELIECKKILEKETEN